jgi:hypothetical protein
VNQGDDHTPVSRDEFEQDFLSFASGPITRLKIQALPGST